MSTSNPPRVILDGRDPPVHSELMQRLHDPYEGGLLVLELMPSRHRTRYSLAVLAHAALGKHVPHAGSRASATDAWERLRAWTKALAPRHIIVARAQHRPRSAWEDLAELAAYAGAQLWLVVSGTAPNRGQRELTREWDAPLEDFTALQDTISPPRHRPLSLPSTGEAFPVVPDDEFPTFLAACLQVHEGPEAMLIKNAYWESFDTAQTSISRNHGLDEELLVSLVRDIGIRAQGDLNENLTRLRAVQAVALRRGYLVTVDADAIAAGYVSQLLASATPESLQRLRRVVRPRDAALAVLALCTHQPPPALSKLNVGDVHEEGAHVLIDGEPIAIPVEGRVALRAHRLHRQWQNATEDHPLFVSEDRTDPQRGPKRTTAHGLQQRLRETSRLTGLILTSRETWGQDQPPRRWLSRRDITLASLGSS